MLFARTPRASLAVQLALLLGVFTSIFVLTEPVWTKSEIFLHVIHGLLGW